MFIRLAVQTILLGSALGAGAGSAAGSDTQVQFNSAGSFGASSALTFDGSTLKVAPTTDDLTPIIVAQNAGTNPGAVSLLAGDRGPVGNVSGVAGNVYAQVNDQLGGLFVHRNATPNNTDWFKYSLNPSAIIEIGSTAEYEARGTAGVITITENTSFKFKVPVTSATRIVINSGFNLALLFESSADSTFIYTGTPTAFITTDGGNIVRMDGALSLVSGAGSPLFDVQNMAQGVFITNSIIIGFGGSTFNALNNFVLQESGFINSGASHTLTNCNRLTLSHTSISNAVSINAPTFILDGLRSNPVLRVVQCDVTLRGTESLLQVSKDVSFGLQMVAAGNIFSAVNKNLFTPSSSTKQVIEAVTDFPKTGTITTFADNGFGRTTVTPNSITNLFDNQTVTITDTTSYNGKFLMFNLTGTTFDIPVVFVADDATGNFDASGITVQITGHGLSTSDFVEITQSNSYNGFLTIFDSTTDLLRVSKFFTKNQTGLVALASSANQTDARILTNLNPGIDDSSYIAPFSINENDVVTVIADADTFQDINLTGQSGSITAFSAGGGGGFTEVAAVNTLSENQPLQILNNVNGYSGAFRATSVTGTTFEIPVTFTVTGTGDFDAGILADEDIQRFRIINAVTGEVEYTGLEPFDGFLTATVGSFKSGAEADYNYILVKNGDVGVRNPYITIGIKTSLVNVTVVTSVRLVTGDTMKLQVAGVGTTDNLTVVNASFLAQRK